MNPPIEAVPCKVCGAPSAYQYVKGSFCAEHWADEFGPAVTPRLEVKQGHLLYVGHFGWYRVPDGLIALKSDAEAMKWGAEQDQAEMVKRRDGPA